MLHTFRGEGINRRADSKTRGTAHFCELLFPLYPEMKIDLTIEIIIPVTLNGGTVNHRHPFWTATNREIWTPVIMQSDLTDTICRWTLFTDNATPKKGERTLASFGFNDRMCKMIDKHPQSEEIYLLCNRQFGPLPS